MIILLSAAFAAVTAATVVAPAARSVDQTAAWPVKAAAAVAGAAAAAALATLPQVSVSAAIWPVVAGVVAAAAAIDLQCHRLPNLLTLPTAAMTSVAVVAVTVAGDDTSRGIAAVAAAACWYGALWLFGFGYLALTGKTGLGGGDMKLTLTLGLVVGWVDPLLVLPAMIIATLIGTVIGVAGIVRTGKSTRLAFGPALAAGAVVAAAAGDPLLDLWLGTAV